MAGHGNERAGGKPAIPVALSVAGSDPSGGAGIQADLKTFHAFGVYGAAVITTLTVQNTRGVQAVHPVAADVVLAQLDAVDDDLAIGAAKLGLVPTAALAEALGERLRRRPLPRLVVDPVLVAGSGDALAAAGTAAALRALLPHALLVTPNLAEAAALIGRPIEDVADMREAARVLVGRGARAALVKGGHLPHRPIDVLAVGTDVHDLDAARIPSGPTHGTGCTLSAGIAAALAGGADLLAAVMRARRFVHRALAAAPRI